MGYGLSTHEIMYLRNIDIYRGYLHVPPLSFSPIVLPLAGKLVIS
jgi:hypothetical protein